MMNKDWMSTNALTRRAALGAIGVGALALAGRRVQAQSPKPAEIKIGVATYLSGPASVFGVPAKHAAELLFDELNAAGGIGGVNVRPIFFDEGPGVDHFVAEYRRLVQSEKVDLMFAAISSADCLACAPIAEEMKRPTLLWDCSTQRIFEEAKYDYVFRTIGNSTPEVLAPVLYLLKYKPNFSTVAVVNQDYVWGRDSWAMFKTVIERLKPGVRVVAEMFPKFGATDYSTEVTRLLATKPDVVFNGSWGGDRTHSCDRLPSASCSIVRSSSCRSASHHLNGLEKPCLQAISSARAATIGSSIRRPKTPSACPRSPRISGSEPASTRSIRASTWRRLSMP
jgi:branched-chain amino acid transport system substrate-binding protein